MWQLFTRYVSVGVLNTLLHWLTFSLLVYALACPQSFANLVAFLIAVTFSFIINAKWTFKKQATKNRYFLFVIFMGSLAWLTGYIADRLHYPFIVTLVAFSVISLIAGFIYSKLVVFREAI
ncbi:GtrA family protein [Erwinia sp. BNK-24-b]|uniref:GtrA family protein n=1 Tax=unclassified Erwinia TaxID=2622719 RepID=UPI0039BF6815